MKKIISLILSGCLAVSLMCSAANYKNWFEYESNSEKVVVTKILHAPAKFTFSALDGNKKFLFHKEACRYNNIFEEIQMPHNLTEIGDKAFIGCKKLRIVKFHNNGLVKTGKEAFADCIALTSVTLPVKTEVLGERTFYNCKSIETAVLKGTNLVIGKECFVGCNALTSVNMNNNVAEIGASAFQSCVSVKELSGLSAVQKVAPNAFYGCTALENVVFSENLKSVGENAFRGCTSLKTVYVSGTIDKNSFYGCENLSTLYLGEGTTSIGEGAFSKCTSLKKIFAPATITEIADGALPANSELIIYGISGSAVNDYATKKGIKFVDISQSAKTYTDSLELPAFNSQIRVLLDGRRLYFDVAPATVDNRTMVPMRTIFEKLGAEVTWLEAYQEVDAVKNNVRIKLKIGSNILYKNTVPIEMDVAPVVMKDRTLVPVRAVAESFLCNVLWDEDRKIVNIINKNEEDKKTTVYPAMEENKNVPDVGKINKLNLIQKNNGVYLYEKTADFEKIKNAINGNLANYGFAGITDKSESKFYGQLSAFKIYTNGVEKVAFGETEYGIILIIF